MGDWRSKRIKIYNFISITVYRYKKHLFFYYFPIQKCNFLGGPVDGWGQKTD